MNDPQWTEVANGPDLKTARRNFQDWLQSHGISEAQLDPDEIRIDTIRGEFVDRRRIMLTKRVIESIT